MPTLVLQDASPSAKKRGHSNEPHVVRPEEIFDILNHGGTHYLFIFEEDDVSIKEEGPDPDVQVQWFGPGANYGTGGSWVNSVSVSESEYAKRVGEKFEAFKDKDGGLMPSSEQIVEILS